MVFTPGKGETYLLVLFVDLLTNKKKKFVIILNKSNRSI